MCKGSSKLVGQQKTAVHIIINDGVNGFKLITFLALVWQATYKHINLVVWSFLTNTLMGHQGVCSLSWWPSGWSRTRWHKGSSTQHLLLHDGTDPLRDCLQNQWNCWCSLSFKLAVFCHNGSMFDKLADSVWLELVVHQTWISLLNWAQLC